MKMRDDTREIMDAMSTDISKDVSSTLLQNRMCLCITKRDGITRNMSFKRGYAWSLSNPEFFIESPMIYKRRADAMGRAFYWAVEMGIMIDVVIEREE